MTWRPRLTALFTQTALRATVVLLGLLVVARSMWASPFLSTAALLMGGLAALLLLLRWRSVLLICFLSRDTTAASVGDSLALLSLPIHRNGAAFVLDTSRIEIRAISLLVFSGVVITGGKTAARTFVAEVLGKFINYRRSGMGAHNA